MTDETPQPEQSGSNEILDELREMAKNLRDTLQTAWDHPERKKLQQDLEQGLEEVSTSLGKAVDEFKQSPTGQTLKADVDDLKERLRTGEVETKARDEILSALRTVNSELRKVSKKEE
jgi:signal recognition particle GTPase